VAATAEHVIGEKAGLGVVCDVPPFGGAVCPP
jgi:hypothetical protein